MCFKYTIDTSSKTKKKRFAEERKYRGRTTTLIDIEMGGCEVTKVTSRRFAYE